MGGGGGKGNVGEKRFLESFFTWSADRKACSLVD